MSGNELSGIELQRKRGDTAADEITVLDDDSTLDPKPPLNIAGFGFFLTVNTEREPDPGAVPPIGVELFSLAGVITDAANGKVEFNIPPGRRRRLLTIPRDAVDTDLFSIEKVR